jgi:hypothetical protein
VKDVNLTIDAALTAHNSFNTEYHIILFIQSSVRAFSNGSAMSVVPPTNQTRVPEKTKKFEKPVGLLSALSRALD